MATTYDKASLVMLPSGYKDDKLYSIKPTDGSGDFTFSRDGAGASPATRVNASGLIEKGRTNIAIYSEDATNAVYSKSNISVTANNATSPIGTATADTITATANGATLQGVVTAVSGRVYTMSVYIKRRTGTGQVGLRGINNLVTNVTITNDWQRYEVFMVSDSTTGRYGVYLATAGDEVDVWGFQLEESLTATEYIATTTAAVSAGLLGDMPRLDYSGGATCPSLLLEPSRVNQITQSEYFGAWNGFNASISDNQTTSPEGVINAAKITEDSSNAFHDADLSYVFTAATHTLSVFAKADERSVIFLQQFDGGTFHSSNNFDLSAGTYAGGSEGKIEPYGNGWYRCSFTATTAAGTGKVYINLHNGTSGNYQGDGTSGVFVYGAQLESSASYVSSYIPTYGSAVTRNRDLALGDNVNVFNSSEGTLFLDFKAFKDDTSYRYIALSDGSVSNRVTITLDNQYRIQSAVSVGGVTQSNIIKQMSSVSLSEGVKIAMTYKNNEFKSFVNGVETTPRDTSGNTFAVGTLRYLRLNQGNLTSNPFLGSIKQVAVFNEALSDSELATLTTL